MDDERTFMLAMQADPEDNGLRMVFADWLEEQGDLRGELIRLQHTLSQARRGLTRSADLHTRQAYTHGGLTPLTPRRSPKHSKDKLLPGDVSK